MERRKREGDSQRLSTMSKLSAAAVGERLFNFKGFLKASEAVVRARFKNFGPCPRAKIGESSPPFKGNSSPKI